MKLAPEEIRTPNLLIRSQMLYPVELRAPESQLICERRNARQLKRERSEQDGLLIYCLRLGFAKEFLKSWIVTDWVPDRVDLQTRDGNHIPGRSGD